MKKGRDVRDYIVDIVTQIENLENFTEGFDFGTFKENIPEIKCLFERILTEMIAEDCE